MTTRMPSQSVLDAQTFIFMSSAPARLRALLARPGCHQMPCCFDALSAKLVASAGFPVTFISGFSAAAAKGLPDTGLLSYAEMEGV